MAVRRRELLAGAAVALAGCAEAREFVEDNAPVGHPLAGETTVAVVDRSESTHDLAALTVEALAFWNENATQYAGVDVTFSRVARDQDPDVEIEFLDDRSELDGCQEHSSENVLGCAPLIREGNRIDRPVVAEVVATDRPYGEVLITTMHELGHMLGLDHDAEPAYIMSNRIQDRLPEYEHRVEVLEAFQAAWQARNDGTRTYNEGISFWNDGDYERAVDPFGRAAERYREIHDHVDAAEDAATAFEEMKRPDTVDRERLTDYFGTTREVADLLVGAAEDMKAAAEAMADGDRLTARNRQESANEGMREVESTDAPSPADVGRALGLVREDDLGGTPAEPSGS
jgi:tetratricopeptide (TPR) repeat protein